MSKNLFTGCTIASTNHSFILTTHHSKTGTTTSPQSQVLPRIVHVLVFDQDFPVQACRLDLADRFDRDTLNYLSRRYSLCQFKSKEAYGKGRRLVGQHLKGLTIRIGRFQGLVEPLGYQRLPLPAVAHKRIRHEHRILGYSVTDLAENWDVSESLIRRILKGQKPPVRPSKKSIKQGISETEPPVPSRVGPGRGGYDQ